MKFSEYKIIWCGGIEAAPRFGDQENPERMGRDMKKLWRCKMDIPFAKAGEEAWTDGDFVVASEDGKKGCATLDPSEWPEFFELVEDERIGVEISSIEYKRQD